MYSNPHQLQELNVRPENAERTTLFPFSGLFSRSEATPVANGLLRMLSPYLFKGVFETDTPRLKIHIVILDLGGCHGKKSDVANPA